MTRNLTNMDDKRRIGAPKHADNTSPNGSERDNLPDFLPDTPRARRLWALRQAVIASGAPLLDDDELEREIAERRGGVALTSDDN